MKFEKQHVSREITGYKSSSPSPFVYKTFAEIGSSGFVPILKKIMADSLSRDDHTIQDAEAELTRLIEMAGDAFDPSCWLLAMLKGETVGLLLPQRYPHKPERGTVFYLGVLPKFRGLGYARLLHSKSLEILARLGVNEYVGSADVLNIPMIKIFEINGCELKRVRSENLPS